MERDIRPYTYEDGYADIGYESGAPPPMGEDEHDIYTPRELEELGKFEHILAQKHNVEDHVEAGERMAYYQVDEKGERKGKIFDMDSRLTWYLGQIAFNMYLLYQDQPHMTEAMNMMTEGYKRDQEQARQFEINELNDMWNNG